MKKKVENSFDDKFNKLINESQNNSKMSFEEAVKACNGITLEEFGKMWDESIRRIIPNP